MGEPRAVAGVPEVNLPQVGTSEETPSVPLVMTIGDFDPQDGSCRVFKYCKIGEQCCLSPRSAFVILHYRDTCGTGDSS